MSKKKKTVTAPLSYDPGKGRPKEYLAYLNWEEMQALRRLNGNNMERGPMGLPSFPPDWGGSANSTGNWSGSGGSVSPGAREGGGSDSGSRGPSSSSAPNAAAANAASNQQAADSAARQAAETKNATTAAKSSALAQDAKKGGIASINVGPMQAPVKIAGGQIVGTISRMSSDTYGLSAPETMPTKVPGAVSAPIPRMNPLNDPSKFIQQEKEAFSGVNPVALSKIVRLQEEFGKPLTITSGVRNPSENAKRGGAKKSQHVHGNAIDVAIPGASAAETARLINLASGVGFSGIGGYRPGKVHVDVGAKRVWGPSYGKASIPNLPSSMRNALTSHMAGTTPKININYASIENAPPSVRNVSSVTPADAMIGEVERSYNPSITPDPFTNMALSGLASLPTSLGSIQIPSIPEQSALVKMMPDAAKIAYANKMAADFAKKIPGALTSGIEALDRMINRPVQTASKPYQDRLMTIGGTTTSVGPENFRRMDPVDREQIDRVQQAQTYDPNFMGPLGDVPNPQVAQRDDYVLGDEAQVYPRYVTPETQQVVEDQERINRRGIGVIKRGMPFFGGIVSGIENLQEQFTDKDIADYGTAQKYKYLQASPEEQAAMRQKYPDVRRFAVSIGDIPPNAGTQYAGGTPTQEPGGKGNDLWSYSSDSYPSYSGGEYSAASAVEEGRPSQYYLWDLGVGVPSPGDPEYNDYQEYLKDRGTTA